MATKASDYLIELSNEPLILLAHYLFNFRFWNICGIRHPSREFFHLLGGYVFPVWTHSVIQHAEPGQKVSVRFRVHRIMFSRCDVNGWEALVLSALPV